MTLGALARPVVLLRRLGCGLRADRVRAKRGDGDEHADDRGGSHSNVFSWVGTGAALGLGTEVGRAVVVGRSAEDVFGDGPTSAVRAALGDGVGASSETRAGSGPISRMVT